MNNIFTILVIIIITTIIYRFSINPRGGSIQKTTISYKMDFDVLTVTTELKSINFTSAVVAKNIWMSNTNQRKNQIDTTAPTASTTPSTSTSTTTTTTTTASTSQYQSATVSEPDPPPYFVKLEDETETSPHHRIV